MPPLILDSEDLTAALAAILAEQFRPGDTILLHGPVGAGKSVFARAVIRRLLDLAGAPPEDIPSPSFTLVQTYQAGDLTIWHADLYRLGGPDEVAELGLSDAFRDALVLVEWPEALDDETPARHLAITLTPDPRHADRRHVTIDAHGPGWDRVRATLDRFHAGVGA